MKETASSQGLVSRLINNEHLLNASQQGYK